MTDPAYDRWVERWREGRTGWHRDDVNRHLARFGGDVFAHAQRVLVPLSGKSLDSIWLEDQGHEVVAVEYAHDAVEAFHTENDRTFERSDDGPLVCFTSGKIRTLVGDFFEVRQDDVGEVDAVYDRAALVAIVPDRREEYVAKLTELIAERATVLLVSFDYPQEEREGPPFSLPDAEVVELFSPAFTLVQLHSADILADQPHWQEAGVTRLTESVFRLDRRPA